MESTNKSTLKCIVSIDFGSSSSGFCFSFIEDTEMIKTDIPDYRAAIDIHEWNGYKAPTVVAYDEHMYLYQSFGKAATKYISTSQHPNDTVLEKFKLKLPDWTSRNGTILLASEFGEDNTILLAAIVEYVRVVFIHNFLLLWKLTPEENNSGFLAEFIYLYHRDRAGGDRNNLEDTIMYFRFLFTLILDQIFVGHEGVSDTQYNIDFIDKYVGYILDLNAHHERAETRTTITFFYDIFQLIMKNINIVRAKQHKSIIKLPSIDQILSNDPNFQLPEIMYHEYLSNYIIQDENPQHDTTLHQEIHIFNYFAPILYTIVSHIHDCPIQYTTRCIPEQDIFFLTVHNSWLAETTKDIDIRATIDFFRSLHVQIMDQIFLTTPTVGRNKLSEKNVHFILTVPSTWNYRVCNLIKDIAASAGLISKGDDESRLVILHENVAAAVYCESELTEKDSLTIGQRYMVCDAGGSSVRVTSFAVTEGMEDSSKFSRCQMGAETTRSCGSTCLDQRMKDLLLRVLFRPKDKKCYYSNDQEKEFSKLGLIDYSTEERKELDAIVADLMNQFTAERGGSKYAFPPPASWRSSNDENNSEDEEGESKYNSEQGSYDSGDEDYSGDEYEEEEEGAPDSNDTVFRILNYTAVARIKFEPNSEAKYIKRNSGLGEMLLVIPYEKMRALVFDPVVNVIVEMLDMNMKKIGPRLAATFLVGGFGRSPYLQYKIRDYFKILKNGKIVGYRCGAIYDDDKGNRAVMRGALRYGIGLYRRQSTSKVANIEKQNTQQDSQSQRYKDYKFVICIDFKKYCMMCCLIDCDTQKTMATFTVETQTTGSNTFLEKNYTSGFRSLYEHLQASDHSSMLKMARYCVLLTSSPLYRPHHKEKIRRAALKASLLDANDNHIRLSFIDTADADAFYTLNKYNGIPKHLHTNFYQMRIYFHDERIEIAAFQATNQHSTFTAYRNVHKITSSSFKYDIPSKMLTNIDSLIATGAVHCQCTSIHKHDRYSKGYFHNLRICFLEFLKTQCHLTPGNHQHEIVTNERGCCTAFISTKQLWLSVFEPVLKGVITALRNCISENTVITEANVESVVIVGNPVDALQDTIELFQHYMTQSLSEACGVNQHKIQYVKNGSLDGAALFTSIPTVYTEKIARRTYALTLKAVKIKPFGQQIVENIDYLEDILSHIEYNEGGDKIWNKIYEIEAQNAYPTTKTVDLFQQDAWDQTGTSRKRTKMGKIHPIIFKGERFSDREDQNGGIRKKFYADEDCIVHAEIWAGVNVFGDDIRRASQAVDFRKLHRFEFYLKRQGTRSRFQSTRFEIHMYTKSNEVLFEAHLHRKFDSLKADFRLRDNALFSNVP